MKTTIYCEGAPDFCLFDTTTEEHTMQDVYKAMEKNRASHSCKNEVTLVLYQAMLDDLARTNRQASRVLRSIEEHCEALRNYVDVHGIKNLRFRFE